MHVTNPFYVNGSSYLNKILLVDAKAYTLKSIDLSTLNFRFLTL